MTKLYASCASECNGVARECIDAFTYRLADSIGSLQTEEASAAMARAWLALPYAIKEKGWPEFVEANGRVAFFGR